MQAQTLAAITLIQLVGYLIAAAIVIPLGVLFWGMVLGCILAPFKFILALLKHEEPNEFDAIVVFWGVVIGLFVAFIHFRNTKL
jgi:hypothetical protein